MYNNTLRKALAEAETDLAKWLPSEHETIIADCQRRVAVLKQELFRREGIISLKPLDSNRSFTKE